MRRVARATRLTSDFDFARYLRRCVGTNRNQRRWRQGAVGDDRLDNVIITARSSWIQLDLVDPGGTNVHEAYTKYEVSVTLGTSGRLIAATALTHFNDS